MAKLTINIGARIDGLKKGLATAQSKIKSWSKKMGKHAKIGLGVGIAGLGVALGAIIKKSAQLAAQFEQIKVAFTTMTGSADKAKGLIEELNEFSKATPFSPEQVTKAGRTLLAFGFEAKQVSSTLKLLGDVSAGTGKDLSEMAVIFGQIKGAGRLMGQDLLQLINAGFNPLQVMSEKTGKSMSVLKDEMSKGAISFDMVEQAFKDATGEGGLFFDMMEKQSKTLAGTISTLEGSVSDLMRQFGEGMLPELKSATGAMLELAKAMGEVATARAKLTSGDVKADLHAFDPRGISVGIGKAFLAAAEGLTGENAFTKRLRKGIEKVQSEILEDGGIEIAADSRQDVAKASAAMKERLAAEKKKALEVGDATIEGLDADIGDFMADLEAGDDFDQLADLKKGDDMIAADAADQAKAAQDQAAKLRQSIGAAFQPGGRIQSRLASIGGERTIDVSGQVAQQQLNVQKQILAVNERVAKSLEDYGDPRFPG